MTRAAAWLAGRELAARRGRVALAALVVASVSAAVTASELVARAREDAVAAQVDAIGAALTVAPAGTTAGALARRDLAGALPPATEARIRAALGRDLRALERRLVLRREVSGTVRPVVGIEPGTLGEGRPAPGAALVGAELGRLLDRPGFVSVEGRAYRVAGALPSTGGADDLALFLPLDSARALAGGVGPNELRLFLRAGVAPRDAERALRAAASGAAVLRSDRGEVADRETHGALARHRAAAYAVMAAVALVCLLVAAHLDAAERRVELATLVAIGASRRTVLASLLLRSALVALAGAGAGVLGGAALAVAAGPDRGVGAVLAGAWPLLASVAAAAATLGALAAAPTAVATVSRDPVRALQEG